MISVQLQPGTYVVAVSGGVDSMVLLDVVRCLPEVKLVVAHVNHGIRPDATEDVNLVRRIAMSYNLIFESTNLYLSKDASEEEARRLRYSFLRLVCKKYNARAILTAHHRNDVIETAVINLLRGTGWRGLSSLRSANGIIRPFLSVPKAELVKYATDRHLKWRYDSTNADIHYLRNRVRLEIIPRIPPQRMEKVYRYIVRQYQLTEQIEDEVDRWLDMHMTGGASSPPLPRYDFIMMPQNVAHELLQEVLRRRVGKSATRPLADRALLFIRVAKPHKIFPLDAEWQLRALPAQVIVERRPTVVSLDNIGSPTGPTI